MKKEKQLSIDTTMPDYNYDVLNTKLADYFKLCRKHGIFKEEDTFVLVEQLKDSKLVYNVIHNSLTLQEDTKMYNAALSYIENVITAFFVVDAFKHEFILTYEEKLLDKDVDEDEFIDIAEDNAKSEADIIDKPPRYNQGPLETIEGICYTMTREEAIGFLKGTIKRYIDRFNIKNGIQDLDKAIVYTNFLKKFYQTGKVR